MSLTGILNLPLQIYADTQINSFTSLLQDSIHSEILNFLKSLFVLLAEFCSSPSPVYSIEIKSLTSASIHLLS